MSRSLFTHWIGHLLAVVLATGCGGGESGANSTPVPSATAVASPSPSPSPLVEAAALLYPDLQALFASELGIFRTCSPNGGVCHNSRQYPDLRSVSSLLQHVGVPCNQLRDDPLEIHDWCETQGDLVRVANSPIEIGYVERAGELVWRIILREHPPDPAGIDVAVVRPVGSELRTLFANLHDVFLIERLIDGRPGLRLELDQREPFLLDIIEALFDRAGVPGDPDAIALGDPNRNGVFGADLGRALILPGAPERSYLLRRLIDPDFGTLMPLANCCSWTKTSLRALWCWIAGLDESGANALARIDYTSCPNGPDERVLYPEVEQPDCEAVGPCPVRAADPVDLGPTWEGMFALMRRSCAGPNCHVGGEAGGFAVPDSESAAYDAVLTRVTPGSAETSELYIRLRPDLCIPPACIPMPFGREPLPAVEVELMREWIEAGASR